MNTKLKAKVVKNRLNKYNVIVNCEGRDMPMGQTFDGDTYRLLEWDTEDEAIEYILNRNDRLELVRN
ncbi:hypothetical protein [Terrisporobacter glycolicus]|uniref:hypothetical protein n=1 Tax=Terrisporobacter glycolicus TaxID=36841 RepID=UPI003464DBE2